MKRHVIDKVIKPEIDATDCAYQDVAPLKKGNKTLAWIFKRQTGAVTVMEPLPIALSDNLQRILKKSIKMDDKGIKRINDCLGKVINDVFITEEYILKVIADIQKKHTITPIKSLGGYVISCIVKGYVFFPYRPYIIPFLQGSI